MSNNIYIYTVENTIKFYKLSVTSYPLKYLIVYSSNEFLLWIQMLFNNKIKPNIYT